MVKIKTKSKPRSKTEIRDDDIKYSPNKTYLQGLLRVALYEVWDGRCHWGGEPIGGVGLAEIDHLIPHTKYLEVLEKVRQEQSEFTAKAVEELSHLTDDPHQVDNLAPICRAHNGMKSDAINKDNFAVTVGSLKKAKGRAELVKRAVHRINEATGLEKSALELLALSNDEETRSCVERYGTSIVSSLWAFDPQVVRNFVEPRPLNIDMGSSFEPDWVGTTYARGANPDIQLALSRNEQTALDGAAILNHFEWTSSLESGFGAAIAEGERRGKENLRSQGAMEIGVVGRHMLTFVEHEFTHKSKTGHPLFKIRFNLSMGFSGTGYDYERTDNDGNVYELQFETQPRYSGIVTLNLRSGKCHTDLCLIDFDSE